MGIQELCNEVLSFLNVDVVAAKTGESGGGFGHALINCTLYPGLPTPSSEIISGTK